ncbi:hypothetical protein KDA_14600 [Dictyobacter alpinus]|uniref:non-specific serine/threonine protein kinase n=1 Tax=Dictyobacter alpinus TaxID=2014873 RepID=A0A402B3Q6_9CHLR|nr:protein kinase [Dictyobacter alpinus]GCE25976.1 hypothetical protein KDA_14600 [Dictyobacter alpinus]
MIPPEDSSAIEEDNQPAEQTLHNGEYVIQRLVTRGETGTIYLARHTSLSTALTLKQIPADQPLPENVSAELDYILHGGDVSRRANPAYAQDSTFPRSGGKYTDLFLREALFLARLQHPALPTLYDYFSENGYWYLVMDTISGQSLQQYLQQSSPLSPLEALGYAMQLCDVLDYLHSQQPPVIFCMLRPETIMLLPDKSLMLFNFSGARYFKESHPLEQAQELFAADKHITAYMAPELFVPQGPLDVRADLYSLGRLLQEMIIGHDRAAHTDEQPQEQVPTISTMLNGLLKLATREEVAERFQSAHVFFLALERAYRAEERLHYREQLYNLSLRPTTTQYNNGENKAGPPGVATAVSEQNAGAETEFTTCVPDLEQRRLTRESLQRQRLEQQEQELLEGHFASMDESLQRRSSTTLSQLSLHALQAPQPRPKRLTGHILHRVIQICFVLALLTFMFLSSLLIYTRILQPAQKHTELPTVSNPDQDTSAPTRSTTLSNTWLRLPALPQAQADNAAVYVEEQTHAYVYTNGAYHKPDHPSYDRTLYRYDITTRHWETVPLAHFPGIVNNAAAVDEQNRIFFTSGYSSDTYNVPSLLYMYQTTNTQLTKIVPPTTVTIGFASSMFADKQGHLYLTEGFSKAGDSSARAGTGWYRYDSATDHWQRLADLPVGLGYTLLAGDEEGHLLLFGGSEDAGQQLQTNHIYRYDIAHDLWSQSPTSMPVAISAASGCTVMPGKLLLVGGYDKARQKGTNTTWLIDTQTFQTQVLVPFTAGGSVLGASACDGQGRAYVTQGADDPHLPTPEFWQLRLIETSG